MDELKHRAGERIEAFQVAAKTAAGTGKTHVQDVYHQTSEAFRKIREALHEIWHNELIAESRERVSAWMHETVQRIREGAPPLSPVLLYEELKSLFKDRVWRRSMLIFVCGATLGGGVGLMLGLRLALRAPVGPHARALHAHSDQGVMLVEDAVATTVGSGEVLVRVQTFSVGPEDRAVLRGLGAALRGLLARPAVAVGRGFAGVVLDVGHGVTDLELGDEVWGCVSEWSGGAACELLTIRSTRVSKRPRALGADCAAALPWAGTRALAALAALGYTQRSAKGKRVLVCGAAAGSGCALVQLLAAWGAHVTALAPRHCDLALRDLGAQDFIESESNHHVTSSWSSLENAATHLGPWDCVLACPGHGTPCSYPPNPQALLRAQAPRGAVLDLRPRPLLSDRLPAPLSLVFAAAFCTFRALRWLGGLGSHTDWLEPRQRLRAGLQTLTQLVEEGQLSPVLDKVFLPQDFEAALARACSEDALGTTVIRFP